MHLASNRTIHINVKIAIITELNINTYIDLDNDARATITIRGRAVRAHRISRVGRSCVGIATIRTLSTFNSILATASLHLHFNSST